MKLANFSAAIRGAISETAEGHVKLNHGQVYAIEVQNNESRKAAVQITIDGLVIGEWIFNAHQRATIERGVDDKGCFTFFRAGSTEAAASGEAHVTAAEKGLVQVRFQPEKPRPLPSPVLRRGVTRGGGVQLESFGGGDFLGGQTKGMSMGAGMTGLTGNSSQEFGTTADIQRDLSAEVTINLRLVEDLSPPVPAAPAVRPIPGRMPVANPVPQPVS